MANGLEMMLSTEVELLQAENARLREENKAFESDVETIAAHNIELQEQLAAAQAVIEQMREAIKVAKNSCAVASSGCSHIKMHAECNEARQFAAATKINVETSLSALKEALALSIQCNLDALHEEMDKEREECAAICDRFYERGMNPAECAGAIRARKQATKEECK